MPSAVGVPLPCRWPLRTAPPVVSFCRVASSQIGADAFQRPVASGVVPAVGLSYTASYGCGSPPPPPFPRFGCGKSLPPLSSIPPSAIGTAMVSRGSGCANSGGCLAGTQAVAFEIENSGRNILYLNAATFVVMQDRTFLQLVVPNSPNLTLFWMPPTRNASMRLNNTLPEKNTSALWMDTASQQTLSVVGDANLRFDLGGVVIQPGESMSFYIYSWSITRIARFNTELANETRLIPGNPVTTDGNLLIRCGYSFTTPPKDRMTNLSLAFSGVVQRMERGFYNQLGVGGATAAGIAAPHPGLNCAGCPTCRGVWGVLSGA